VIGVVTGLWGRWPIWDIRSAIRRSAMSYNAMVCRRHENASARNLVGILFGSIWRCWRRRTSCTTQRSQAKKLNKSSIIVFPTSILVRADEVIE
jgi:hypothetical protein